MTGTLRSIKLSHIEPYCLLNAIKKNLWMIFVAAIFFAMVAGTAVTLGFHDNYGARVTLVVSSRASDSNAALDNSTADGVAEMFAQLLDTDLLRGKIAQAAGYPTYSDEMTVQSIVGTNLVNVSLVASSEKQAYCLIRSVCDSYTLLNSYVSTTAIITQLSAPVIYRVPALPMSDRRVMLLAGIVGAIAMLLYLLLYALLRDTIQTEDSARDKLDARLLATIRHEASRKKQKSLLVTNPMTSFSYCEAVQKLCSLLEQKRSELHRAVFLVSSVQEHEGKSTLLANLALSMQDTADSILIVDADFRKPSSIIEKTFADDDSQWAEIRSYQTELYTLRLSKWGESKVFALHAPKLSKNLTDLLQSDLFRDLIVQLEQSFSYILIDTPPLSLFSDAERLAQFASASLLVVQQDGASAAEINDAIDTLNSAGGKCIGVVLNDFHRLSFGLHRHSGYGTYARYGKYGSYDKYGAYGKYYHGGQEGNYAKNAQ